MKQLFSVFALLLFFQPRLSFAYIEEKEFIEMLEKDMGPVAPEKEIRELSEVFQKIFNKLMVAQESMAVKQESISISRLYIVDSPIENAFVVPDKREGIQRAYNRVVLTTAIIKKMIRIHPNRFKALAKSPDAEASKAVAREYHEGLMRLAGIVAHELAHPLDNLDRDGIHNRNHSQAQEIRADAEGALITEKAGYPIESLYSALKRLFDRPSRGMDLASAAAGSHPQNSVRLSSMKTLLTVKRYQQGNGLSGIPESITQLKPENVIQELFSTQAHTQMWKFTEPKNLEDALRRFQHVLEPEVYRHKPEDFRIVELNRLLLYINNEIQKEENGERRFSKAEKDGLFEFRKSLVKNKMGIVGSQHLRKLLVSRAVSGAVINYPSHETSLRKLRFYNSREGIEESKRARREVDIELDGKPKEGKHPLMNRVHRLTALIAGEALFNEYKSEILAEMKNLFKKGTVVKKDRDQNQQNRSEIENLRAFWLEGRSPVLRGLSMNVFTNEIWDKADLQQKLYFLRQEFHSSPSQFFNFFMTSSDYSDTALEAFRKHLQTYLSQLKLRVKNGDKAAAETLNAYKSVAKRVWQDRALFSIFELTSEKSFVDWTMVAETIDIPKDQVQQKLRKSIRTLFQEAEKNNRSSLHEFFRIQRKLGVPDRYEEKVQRLKWVDSATKNFLLAQVNQLRETGDKPGNKNPRKSINDLIYRENAELFLKHYKEKAKNIARSLQENTKNAELFHNKTLRALVTNVAFIPGLDTTTLSLILTKSLIEETQVSKSFMKKFLFELFLAKQHNMPFPLVQDKTIEWSYNSQKDRPQEIYKILHKYEVVGNVFDFLAKYRQQIGTNNYFNVVGIFHQEIISSFQKQMSATSNAQEKKNVLRTVSKLMAPFSVRSKMKGGKDLLGGEGNVHRLRKIKTAVFTAAEGANLSTAEKYRLFLNLTSSGATRESDVYFEKNLEKSILSSKTMTKLENILRGELILSKPTRLRLAKEVLNSEIESIGKEVSSSEETPRARIHKVLERLEAMAPGDSIERDKLMEKMAWKFGLEKQELASFVEEEKAFNWKKSNPGFVNLASTLGEIIHGMKTSLRWQMIEYMRNPSEGSKVLDYITKEVEEATYRNLAKQLSASDLRVQKSKLRSKAAQSANAFRDKFEKLVHDASPTERLPIFELLISAGDNRAISKQRSFPGNILNGPLEFEKGSTDEARIRAFLQAIPTHERTVHLAYMLSLSGEDRADINNYFKIFQTVGIKFGQYTSIWKVFGEEVAEQTKKLKDNANPLSKHEAMKVVQKTLLPEEYRKIVDWVRVLGSASVKTVYEVKMQDGRSAAIMVQNPHIEAQIASNMQLSERFMAELKKMGIFEESALFRGLVDGLKAQLAEEIDMTREAKNIERMAKLFESYNHSLKSGWKFNVPRPIEGITPHKNVLLTEMVSGTSFDKLAGAQKKTVGLHIVESSLQMLFKDGVFEPDRHQGNFLIDEKTRTIHAIDFGQLEDFGRRWMFSRDARLTLARFIHAFSAKDAKQVVEQALQMAEKTSPNQSLNMRGAIEEIAEVFERANFEKETSDVLNQVVETLSKNGVNLQKRYMFGALKGLIVLLGENYVSPAEFRQILSKNIRGVYARKLPYLIGSGEIFKLLRQVKSEQKQNSSKSVMLCIRAGA